MSYLGSLGDQNFLAYYFGYKDFGRDCFAGLIKSVPYSRFYVKRLHQTIYFMFFHAGKNPGTLVSKGFKTGSVAHHYLKSAKMQKRKYKQWVYVAQLPYVYVK